MTRAEQISKGRRGKGRHIARAANLAAGAQDRARAQVILQRGLRKGPLRRAGRQGQATGLTRRTPRLPRREGGQTRAVREEPNINTQYIEVRGEETIEEKDGSWHFYQ